jgi:glycosyltransferase involved in cell wall biosynthesis
LFDYGGFKGTIKDKVTGWLFPVGDADALAECLRQALSMNDEQRAEQAKIAIDHIRTNFTKDKMCSDTLDVYADLLRNRLGG